MRPFRIILLFSALLLFTVVGFNHPAEKAPYESAFTIDHQANDVVLDYNIVTLPDFSNDIQLMPALHASIFVLEDHGQYPQPYNMSRSVGKLRQVNNKARAPPYNWAKHYSRTFNT